MSYVANVKLACCQLNWQQSQFDQGVLKQVFIKCQGLCPNKWASDCQRAVSDQEFQLAVWSR